MTGRVPKTALLKPEFVIVITFELLILLAKKLTGQYKGVIYNTGAQVAGKAITASITLLITVIIGKNLGPAGYGDFTKIC